MESGPKLTDAEINSLQNMWKNVPNEADASKFIHQVGDRNMVGDVVESRTITSDDLSFAQRILDDEGRDQGIMDVEVKELRWDQDLANDLRTASRAPGKKEREDGERMKKYRRDREVAITRLQERGYEVDKLGDFEERRVINKARMVIFEGREVEGMSEDEAAQTLRSMGIDVGKVKEERERVINIPITVGSGVERDGFGGPDRQVRRFDLSARLHDLDEIEHPQDRIREINSIRRDLLKYKPEGWKDALNNLREKENQEQMTLKTVELTPEQIEELVQYCLDEVFDRGANNADQVQGGLFRPGGFLQVRLGVLPEDMGKYVARVRAEIDKMGLDNWVAVRNNIKEWSTLKGMEEVTGRNITTDLFLPIFAEKWFAGKYDDNNHFLGRRMVAVPGELGGEVDIQFAVSGAMKRMRQYFEGSWTPDPNDSTAPGTIETDRTKWEAREYWGFVGTDMAQKQELYKRLGINKYVGEVAFSLLLSHNMLTDTSSYDIFLSMVDSAKKRVAGYKVSEERDPFVRMYAQRIASNGGEVFTSFEARAAAISDDANPDKIRLKVEAKRSKEQIEKFLARVLPRHMIPTGMTRGRDALMDGEWLTWRVQHDLYMTSQKSSEKERGAENPDTVATDPEARKNMMANALDVLTQIKECSKPESGLDKLEGLKGKLLKWTLGDLATVGWTRKVSGQNLVHREFGLEDESGNTVDMDPAGLASKIMLIASEMFLFTHSIADTENQKPWMPDELAAKAGELFASEAQSGKGTYIGLNANPEINRVERISLVGFIDKLWRDTMQVVNATSPANQTWAGLKRLLSADITTIELPKWFARRGVPLTNEVITTMQKHVNSTAWSDMKSRLGF